MPIKVHFYSDCYFFAGCENMLSNFFMSDDFVGDITFSYRYSSEYEKGFKQRVSKNLIVFPLPVVCSGYLFKKIGNEQLAKMAMIASSLLLLRFWILIYNTFLIWKTLGKVKNIDVLHINNGGYPGARSCMAAVFAGRFRGVKCIVYVVNNIAVDYSSPKRWADFLLDKVVINWVDVFVTGSTYAKGKLEKSLGLRSNQAFNIYNGIMLRDVTEAKAQVIKRLSLPRNRVVCVVVAVLEERKGHMYLLEAMQRLKHEAKTVPVLVIEGVGQEVDKLLRFVRQSGLEEDVFFIGEEPNVFNILNMADIVILPSIRNEDFPNVILEAMGLGKPVIASTVSGIPEQIDHDKTGLLIPPKDVKKLSVAISRLMSDAQVRLNMGKQGKIKFERNFSEKIAVAKYKKLYGQILKGK